MFGRFAERHGLTYEVAPDPPMEVLWEFPEQEKLSQSLTLGLQNSDELNFGVADFWSYFFPYDLVADDFESYIDAWVEGDARVAITGRWSRVLQVRDGAGWKAVYSANGCLFPFSRRARRYVQNTKPGS